MDLELMGGRNEWTVGHGGWMLDELGDEVLPLMLLVEEWDSTQ
jgi:hypothetical protein